MDRPSHPTPLSGSEVRPVFRRRHRLSGSEQFAEVFGAKLKKSSGPITVFLRATDLDEHRLGLSIGRSFGNAVARGRFKRIIREVFRHQRASLPSPGLDNESGSYDIVVSSRRHEPMTIEEYTRLFVDAVNAAHRVHCKRQSDA